MNLGKTQKHADVQKTKVAQEVQGEFVFIYFLRKS